MITEIKNSEDVHYLLGAFIGTVESVCLWADVPAELKLKLQQRLKELEEVKIIFTNHVLSDSLPIKVRELLILTEENGDVVNGFRTQDIIKELRALAGNV